MLGAWVGLQCVIVVFPDHTHLLFVECEQQMYRPACALAQAGLQLCYLLSGKVFKMQTFNILANQ